MRDGATESSPIQQQCWEGRYLRRQSQARQKTGKRNLLIAMATLKSRNVALLTGAGFTKSFGGYLASEMWAKIFNHPQIQGNESIRRCMLRHVNFEDAYAAVMDSENYSETEKKAFTEAVRTAFEHMHRNILDRALDAGEGIWNVIDPVINLFCGDENEPGLFFTLNQDLFMEAGFAKTPSEKARLIF